jgi:hypothetical protein
MIMIDTYTNYAMLVEDYVLLFKFRLEWYVPNCRKPSGNGLITVPVSNQPTTNKCVLGVFESC